MNHSEISWKVIDKFFYDNENILVKHHIDSYNNFFSTGIQEIFKDKNPIRFFKEQDKETQEYKYECELYLGGVNCDKIYYGKPIIYDESVDEIDRAHYMYPNEARLRNMTYGFTIHYDIDVKFKILIEIKDHKIILLNDRWIYNIIKHGYKEVLLPLQRDIAILQLFPSI